jgi:hypothetical protein
MIQVYKAIHGNDDINWMSLFMLVPSTAIRGHSLKIFKKQCRTTQRLHTFSMRIIDQWNGFRLPSYMSLGKLHLYLFFGSECKPLASKDPSS